MTPGFPQRIVFAGSPEFAVIQLDALIDAGLPVTGVLSQPDRPAGRKRRLQPTPVKARALERGIDVATPASLRKPQGQAELEAMAPDLLIVAAYGLILPAAVLALPRLGCLNVHASLLPRWRGAAPVERALMAGDTVTGVCIMQMDEGLDTGPVRLAEEVPILATDTGGELEVRLAQRGATALLHVLADLDGHPARAQPETGATYAHKLGREDSRLDFTRSAGELALQIRALNPRLPATVRTAEGKLQLRLLRAAAHPGSADGTPPGAVISIDRSGLHIATPDGTLSISEVQLVGGKGTVLAGAALHNALDQRLTPGDLLDGA